MFLFDLIGGGPATCAVLKLEDVPDLNYYAVGFIEVFFCNFFLKNFRRTEKARFLLKGRQ